MAVENLAIERLRLGCGFDVTSNAENYSTGVGMSVQGGSRVC
jgi:hypothetical protein